MTDHVEVATGGTIERHDRCEVCSEPRLYHVDATGNVNGSLCGNWRCPWFLVEIPE
jgi:hypothetical protein